MRDKRFIAKHRGGPLTKEEHKLLILWSCKCVEHVLPLYGEKIPNEITNALQTAKLWAKEQASVGNARNCAFALLKLARTLKDDTQIYIVRAAQHCVSTAHMADHSSGAAEYALKALLSAGKPIDQERKYQDKILPKDIKELVLTSRANKNKFWKSSFQNTIKKRNKLMN